MPTPRVLWRGRLSIAEIVVTLSPDEWAPPEGFEALVRDEWESMQRRAKEPLWDGTYYRVLNAAELNDRANHQDIRMHLGTVSYRYIATFRALCEQYAPCSLAPLEHLSTGALIRTLDGYYLFGKRAQNGSIDLIGGGVQRDEMPISTGADLEANLFKEIHEEVGIRRGEIRNVDGIGIVRSETSNVVLVAHAQIELSRGEAERTFANRTDPEMAEPVFVTENELIGSLRNMGDYRALLPDLL